MMRILALLCTLMLAALGCPVASAQVIGANDLQTPMQHFQFSGADATVTPGYTQVTDSTDYTSGSTYGIVGSTVSGYEVFDSSPTTVGVESNDLIFQDDLANGTYSVTLTLGDPTGPHTNMEVYLQGQLLDTVSTSSDQLSAIRTYTVAVADGQLILELTEPGSYASIENMVIIQQTPAQQFQFSGPDAAVAPGYTQVTDGTDYTSGATYGIVGSTMSGYEVFDSSPTTVGVESNDLIFRDDVANGTYSVALTIGDPAGPHGDMDVYLQGQQVDTVSTSSGQLAVMRTYSVAVSNGQLVLELTEPGSYASIEDMVVALQTPAQQFQFSGPDATVASGYTQVTDGTDYTSGATYGIVGSTMSGYEVFDSSPTTVGVESNDLIFQDDVANGTYSVTLTIGDPAGPHGDMDVYLQGQQVDTVSTSSGQLAVTRTYSVAVSNGQLVLELTEPGSYASIEDMVVALQSPAQQFQFSGPDATIAPGYTQVTDGRDYTSGATYGIVGSAISGYEVFDSSPTTVGVESNDLIFQDDVANGTYSVTLTIGDPAGPHGDMDVYLQGQQVDTVSTSWDQLAVTRTYTVAVSNGQLVLELTEPGSFASIEDMVVALQSPAQQFQFSGADASVAPGYRLITGSTGITSGSPFGIIDSTVAGFEIYSPTPTSPNVESNDLIFQDDVANGTYSVTLTLGDPLGPHSDMQVYLQGQLLDTVSTSSDQLAVTRTYTVAVSNGQLVLELTEPGSYASIENMVVALQSPAQQFQFSGAEATVAPGYRLITASTGITSGSPFGIIDSTVAGSEIYSPTSTSPNVESNDLIFQDDVANGTYSVTLTLGDPLGPHSDMQVYLQGQLVDTVSTSSDQLAVTRTYTVAVSNGQLVLELTEPGSYASIEDMVVALQSPAQQFQFSGADATVAPGYRLITGSTGITSGSPFGIVDSTVAGFEIYSPTPTSTNVESNDLIFQDDVANGTYSVTLTLGDPLGPHSDMQVYLQGQLLDTVSTSSDQLAVTRTYTVAVSNGQLVLELTEPGSYASIEDMVVALQAPAQQLAFGPEGMAIATGYTPVYADSSYTSTTGFGFIPSTTVPQYEIYPYTAADPTGSALTNNSVESNDLIFRDNLPNGTYSVTLTLGDAGYDHDGMEVYLQGALVYMVSAAAGDPAIRTYTAAVSNGYLLLEVTEPGSFAAIEGMVVALQAPAQQFAFGPEGLAIATGYMPVYSDSSYNSTTGFGFIPSTTVAHYEIYPYTAADPTGSALTNNSVESNDLIFRDDLPNGTYSVTLTLGDAGYDHDGMEVYLQGALVDTASAAAGDPAIRTYTVAISNGYLLLEVTEPGSFAAIEGLVVAFQSTAQARSVGIDTTTQGNWRGTYGGDGYDIAGDPSSNNPSLPSYAAVSLSGAASYTWTTTTSDPRALEESAPGSTNRVAGVWYSPTSFSINLTLTDGQTHLLALYVADWDGYGGGRSEQVQLISASTGTVLDSQTISAFQNGEYLVWNVTGSVTIVVTNLNPHSNAIINGLFLGGAQATTPVASARFVRTDTTTQGNWQGTYGTSGFDIAGDPSSNNPSLPSYASVSLSGAGEYTWTTTTSDPRALEESAPGSTNRVAGVWYSPTSFSINLTLTDGQTHLLALYVADWDGYGGGRSEQIQLISASTGTVLDSQTISAFQNGEYLVWNVTGSVTIVVTNLNPNSNAIINGLFLGGA